MPRPARRRPARLLPPALALVLTVAWLVLTLVVPVGPASAETPAQVADGLSDDGVFVGFGRSEVDEEDLIAAVADARRRNLDLVVVVPWDPQPTAKAFARRVQEFTEVDVALVFPDEGPVEAYVNDEMEQAAGRPRALEEARGLDDPAAAVGAFTEELLSVETAGRPEIVDRILRWLTIFALVIGVVVVVELIISWARRPTPTTSG